MSKRKKTSSSGAMLDLWRPPKGAGDPVGCLATTYTFAPGLFDEQCLARFLEIDSEPNREDLAFLLERESRLGEVYAGVLVDHTQAGVEHSLRWDVLPVRIRAGKQHAKLSLLSWNHHVRIIVASANLTDAGYRINQEIAAAVDFEPASANKEIIGDAITFLRNLLGFVPGISHNLPEAVRAVGFLDQVERHVEGWKHTPRKGTIKQQLAFTLPAADTDLPAQSSLEQVIRACRRRGGSPTEVWVASPFFDPDEKNNRVTASLCKLMARGGRRNLHFCVPAIGNDDAAAIPRLAAPESLRLTPAIYNTSVNVSILPDEDKDKNTRSWHAKVLGLYADRYSGLMIGSSNFTCAGMGVSRHRNAEANLLTLVDRVAYSRETGQLDEVWPDMEPVVDLESAEWVGTRPDQEEEQATAPPVPAGFLSATYRAGENRQVVLRLDPQHLPEDWYVDACGQEERQLVCASEWNECGRPSVIEITWTPVQPPEKLLVRWADNRSFMPLNVEDNRKLPPPAQLDQMSADDMLWILAAADPSAAFRAWAGRQRHSDRFDPDIDSATPIDLDPLRRYDLQATFLHRIRRRARILAQVRSNLQRPVLGRQALEWRLKGLVGVEQIAERFVREFADADGTADEVLLTLSDFLILLHEVDYQPTEGALKREEFEDVFRSFLKELAEKLRREIEPHRDHVSEDLMSFWQRVLERCAE